METIDEILSGSDEGTQQVVDQQVDDVDEGQVDDQSTGVDGDQVAADDINDQTDDAQQPDGDVKSELKALAKERERIRQKEAALDAELAKLQEQQSQQTAGDNGQGASLPADLKELRKMHREALEQAIVDPTDEEAAQRVDLLEDQIEAVRLQQITQALKSEKVQEKAVADFTEVFDAVHAEYPFLDPEHPKADAMLNADINAFYDGLLKRGESKAVALRKAVDTFAPAQAKKLGMSTSTKPATQKPAAQAATSVAREKLKGGFSEVPGTGSSSRSNKMFTGPTPMEDILGRSST